MARLKINRHVDLSIFLRKLFFSLAPVLEDLKRFKNSPLMIEIQESGKMSSFFPDLLSGFTLLLFHGFPNHLVPPNWQLAHVCTELFSARFFVTVYGYAHNPWR